jgi:hypothetical protein
VNTFSAMIGRSMIRTPQATKTPLAMAAAVNRPRPRRVDTDDAGVWHGAAGERTPQQIGNAFVGPESGSACHLELRLDLLDRNAD